MPLCTAQQELFTSTFLPLLTYANAQCHVVRDLPTSATSDDDGLRLELVARALWHHKELIDDYLRDDPDGLSPEQRAIVHDLRGTLYGEFLFDGREDSHATLLHDSGAYHVVCLDDQAVASLPDRLCTMRCAIAPYRGHILLVWPIVIVGEASPTQRQSLLRRLKASGHLEPVTSGEELARRSASWDTHEKLRTQRQEEQCRQANHIGEGYHRGLLAGVTEPERSLQCRQHQNAHLATTEDLASLLSFHSIPATLFPFSLAEALDLLEDDWLASIAEQFSPLGAPLPTARDALIDHITKQAPHDDNERDSALTWCEAGQFDLIRRLLRQNPLSLIELEPLDALSLYPMPPYTFILHEKESFVAWIPPEMLAIVTHADFDTLARLRARLSEAERAADALASMCGVISLDDAYQRYCEAVSEPLSREQFELAIIELESSERRDTYALWEHESTSYLISGELSGEGVMARVVRAHYADRILHVPTEGDQATGTSVVVCDPEEQAEIASVFLQALEGAERTKHRLLQAHNDVGLGPHPLAATMLDRPFIDHLLGMPPLIRLRNYVDGHIPDHEDDYEFPTTFCRAVIISALFEHESYHEVLDIIRLFGMEDCEGDHYPHQLGKLVTDVFNTLPAWQLNGWSLNENTERLTGQEVIPQACA